MNKINQSIDRLAELSKGLKKDDPYIDTLIEKLDNLEQMLLTGLEEDERLKAQKKAS